MKKSRFKEEEMVKILREADQKYGTRYDDLRLAPSALCQLEPIDVKRLRQLEHATPSSRSCSPSVILRSM